MESYAVMKGKGRILISYRNEQPKMGRPTQFRSALSVRLPHVLKVVFHLHLTAELCVMLVIFTVSSGRISTQFTSITLLRQAPRIARIFWEQAGSGCLIVNVSAVLGSEGRFASWT